MEHFFKPVCDAYDAGGFYFTALDQTWCMLPVVAYFTVDSSEANAMCGVRASVNSHFPCRFCWCPGDDMNDPNFEVCHHLRDALHMRQLGTVLGRMKGTKGKKVAAERLLSKYSLHAGQNTLWNLPYGANKAGIYGACPPELLHQYLLGIMKYAYQFTCEIIDGKSPPAGTAKSATAARVDARFKIFSDRHVDPELPRLRFTRGAMHLPYLEGKDYRALLLQFIVVLGVGGGTILSGEKAAELQVLLWDICELYDLLHELSGHTFARLNVIKRKVSLMMTAFKRVFSEYSRSDCCFQKFHFTLHLLWPIMEWGSLRAVDTCFGEAMQGDVRLTYRQTSRRNATVHSELARATALARVIVANARRYGISLNPQLRRQQQSDCFRGKGHDYDVSTGATEPHLRLSQGVRGGGLRRALLDFSEVHKDCFGDVADLTVVLHTSMSTTVEGSSASVIFHANPMVYFQPWYDSVMLLAAQDGGLLDSAGVAVTTPGDGGFAFWAGKLETFVYVAGRGVQGDRFLALVRLYGRHRPKSGRAKRRRTAAEFDWCHDLDSPLTHLDGRLSRVPFNYMELCTWGSTGDPFLWLVDTEAISLGLWTQECFDNPGKYWFIRRGGSA